MKKRDQPIKTFVDANILLLAWRGEAALRMKAATVLTDINRHFISSDFVRLELLPKALYHKNQAEQLVYEMFFNRVQEWVDDTEQIVAEGLKVGARYGLNALDALHVAAALLAGADEFVTAERPTSPLSRVQGMTVVSLLSK
jgi:predicted nucleic acid-binding protein